MTGMRKLLPFFVTSALLFGSASAAFSQVSFDIRIGTPPPPPRAYYVAPMPGPDYFWVEGYWYPQGSHYVWHNGYWTRPPYAGAYWVAPYYASGRYVAGYWERGDRRWEHDHRWDRDHDRRDFDRDHDRR